MGDLGVLVGSSAHDLFKCQLRPEILHVEVDVKLCVDGQAGRRVSLCACQPAHTDQQLDGSGTMAVLGDTEQGRKKSRGNIGVAARLVKNTGHRVHDQIAEQQRSPHHVPPVRDAGGVRTLDVQDALQPAHEIRPLDQLEFRLLLLCHRQELIEGGRRRAGKNEYRARNGAELSVQGVLSVLHGRKEILQPAAVHAVALRVELIEEHQRDPAHLAAERLVQRPEQSDRITVLGQVQGRDMEPAAAHGDLLHAEGLARSGRSEHCDGQRLHHLVLSGMLTAVNVVVQQSVDRVIALDLVQVHGSQRAVAAHRHVLKQVLRPVQDDLLCHRKIAARLVLAVFIQNAERSETGHQALQASLGKPDAAHLSLLVLCLQFKKHIIKIHVRFQRQMLAAVRGKIQRPLSSVPDQRAFLIEQHRHILVAAEGPQCVIGSELQQEFIHRPFIGDSSGDGEIQLS